MRDVDVTGVFSKTKQSADDTAVLANDLGVGSAKSFDSITEMIADPEADTIWVCSPNYARIETFEEIVRNKQRTHKKTMIKEMEQCIYMSQKSSGNW